MVPSGLLRVRVVPGFVEQAPRASLSPLPPRDAPTTPRLGRIALPWRDKPEPEFMPRVRGARVELIPLLPWQCQRPSTRAPTTKPRMIVLALSARTRPPTAPATPRTGSAARSTTLTGGQNGHVPLPLSPALLADHVLDAIKDTVRGNLTASKLLQTKLLGG